MRFITSILILIWALNVQGCVEMEKNPCEKPEDSPLFHLNHGAQTIGAGLAEMLTGMTPDASNFSPQIDPIMPPPAPAPMPMAAAHKTHKRVRRAINGNQFYRPSSLPYNILGLGDSYARAAVTNNYQQETDKGSAYYYKDGRHPFFPAPTPYSPIDPCNFNNGHPKNDKEWMRRFRLHAACKQSFLAHNQPAPMVAPSPPPSYGSFPPVAPPMLPIRPDYFQNPPSQAGFFYNPSNSYPVATTRGPTPPAPPRSEQRQICYDQYGRYTDCDDIQYKSFAKPQQHPDLEKNSIADGEIIQGYAQPAAGVYRLAPVRPPARPVFEEDQVKEFDDRRNDVEDAETATLASRRRN